LLLEAGNGDAVTLLSPRGWFAEKSALKAPFSCADLPIIGALLHDFETFTYRLRHNHGMAVRTTIDIPEPLHDRLRDRAERSGTLDPLTDRACA
jgi:hypothetical protein